MCKISNDSFNLPLAVNRVCCYCTASCFLVQLFSRDVLLTSIKAEDSLTPFVQGRSFDSVCHGSGSL